MSPGAYLQNEEAKEERLNWPEEKLRRESVPGAG